MWAYADRGGVTLNRTIGFEANVKSNIDSPYDTATVGGGVDGIVSATVDGTGICNNAYRVTQSSGAGWRTGFQVPFNSIAPSVSDEGEICKFGGSSSVGDSYGGIRFYGGNFDYASKTNDGTFNNNVAYQLARGQKVLFGDTRGLSTWMTYDTDSAWKFSGNAMDLLLSSSSPFRINGVKLLGNRRTGFGVVNGTTDKTTFDTSTVNLQELAQRVGAIWEALREHGLIGN